MLHNHGRRFLQTNQFAELLIYLRRTGSRLVIPEMTYNEVVARYGERLTAVAKAARDAWSTLQQVGMQERMDFLEPDIKSELAALGELLHHPAQGVQTVMHTDYSGVDVKQVVRRGIGRVRPANDKGEELRDVILWLIVLRYAKQSKARIVGQGEDTCDASGAEWCCLVLREDCINSVTPDMQVARNLPLGVAERRATENLG